MATGNILGALGGTISFNLDNGLIFGGIRGLLQQIYGRVGTQQDIYSPIRPIGLPAISLGPQDSTRVTQGPRAVVSVLGEQKPTSTTLRATEPTYRPTGQPSPTKASSPVSVPNQITLNPIETIGSGTTLFQETGGNMPLNLGDLLGQVGQAVVDYQINRFTNPQTGVQGPVQFVNNPLIPDFIEDSFGNSLFGDETVAVAASCEKKKKRRRRRRLATPSDIKDLAALKAVTTGPEMKTWIATHPS